MTRVDALPQPVEHSSRAAETLAAAELPVSIPSSDWIYIIQVADKLPTIDVTRTLAGAVVGRRRTRQINDRVIRFATQHSMLWHATGLAFIAVCLLVFFVETTLQKTLVSITLLICISPVLCVHAASLCYDMLMLVMQTYEFWFIHFANTVNFFVWILLFRDIRILAMLIIGMSCVLTVFLDANLHMRLVVLRLFVVGSPIMLVAVLMVTLRLTPDLQSTPFFVGGVALDLTDALASGTSTIAFFLIMRVFPNRRRILAGQTSQPHSTEVVQCELFFPTCRLIPYETWLRLRHRIVPREPRKEFLNEAATQLEFVDRDHLRIVDARDTLLNLQLLLLRYGGIWKALTWATNFAGIGLLFASGVFQVLHADKDVPEVYSRIALVSTIISVISSSLHYQRTLLRRIIFEMDAWFV